MNWEPAINLLVQIPLVGIFVWFVLKMDERNKDYQDKRDALYEKSLNQITRVLSELKNCFEKHDARLVEALQDMEKEKEKEKEI